MLNLRLWFFVLWATLGTYAFAQQTGGLRGAITDQSGAAIPGAQISVSGEGGILKTSTSGNDGSYVVNGLAPGKYSVQAAAPGLAQGDAIAVDVGNGITTVNILMRIVVERQQVTIQENQGPQVSTDPSNSAATLVIRDDALDALSDDPDDLQADLLALAGPSAGPNGGQMFIDGLTAGDSALPNKDAIREVRVNQNPFSPEYDAIGYGRVEIFTRPGRDKFRGQMYFNYGNGLFNSRNPYAQQKAPFDLKQFGGSAGGAFTKKGSYFVEIDKRNIDNGIVIDTVTLNSALAVTPFTQVISSPVERFRISPRIDYQLNQNNTLMFRYAITSTTDSNTGAGGFNLASTAFNSHLVEHAYQATENAVLGTSVIDETRFQFLHQHQSTDSTDRDPSVNVSSAFSGGGPQIPQSFFIHHHYEVQNNLSFSKGSHAMKVGVRLRAVSIQDSTEQNFDGTYIFGGGYAPILGPNNQPLTAGIVCSPSVPNPGCQTISSIEQYRRTLLFQQMGFSPQAIRLLGGGATQFSINTGNPLVLVGQVDAGVYVADDWRLRPNLTISLGLRYEAQNNIRDQHDFGPRLGLAWAPGVSYKRGGRPKTVFRGGFGIFYDRFNEQNILIAERFNGAAVKQEVVINPDTYPNIPPASQLQVASGEAIHTVSPLVVAPYVLQSAIGVERQIPGNTTVSVTYTNSHALLQLLSRNINAPLPGTYTGVAGSGVYPYPGQGAIYEMESAGLYNQSQIVVNVNSRVTPKVSLFGYYILSNARSNTDGVNTFPANQYSLSEEYGPSSTDVRNRATIGGSLTAKWNVRLSPLITLQSGAPFNITTSQDVYGDTLLTARPGLVTNPNTPGAVATTYGLLDPNPGAGETILPRNFGRSTGLYTVDLRLSKTFGLGKRRPERVARNNSDSGVSAPAAPAAGPARRGGIGGFDGSGGPAADGGSTPSRYNLTTSISARNLLNHVNHGPIIGNINSPLFGTANQIAGGFGAFSGSSNNRRLEFQLRLSF